MIIKRVYFTNAIISLQSLTVISKGELLSGKIVDIKYSDKLNSIIVNNTIIPMHMVREIIFEEEKVVETKPVKEVKPKEVK